MCFQGPTSPRRVPIWELLLVGIYTKTEGIMDWRVCQTRNPSVDFEISAMHIGLVFSPLVYSLVAERLAAR
jgi:hypothetical protein